MIARLRDRPMVQAGLLIAGLFAVAAVALPFLILNVLASSVLLTLSIAVVLAYWRPAVQGFVRRGGPTRSDVLAMGIELSWLGTGYGRISALGYRLFGWDGAIANDLVTFALFVSCAGAVLHLTAPHDDAIMPRRRRGWISLWVALAAGAGIAGFLLGRHWTG